MKSTKKGSVKVKGKMPFAHRHPRINFIIGLALLIMIVLIVLLVIWFVFLV